MPIMRKLPTFPTPKKTSTLSSQWNCIPGCGWRVDQRKKVKEPWSTCVNLTREKGGNAKFNINNGLAGNGILKYDWHLKLAMLDFFFGGGRCSQDHKNACMTEAGVMCGWRGSERLRQSDHGNQQVGVRKYRDLQGQRVENSTRFWFKTRLEYYIFPLYK